MKKLFIFFLILFSISLNATTHLFTDKLDHVMVSDPVNYNFVFYNSVTNTWDNGEFTTKEINILSASPVQITANQNNYSVADYSIWRLNTDASRNITGFVAENYKKLTIINVGSNDIVLKNQDVSSTAGNRIITGTGADITLVADDVALLWYDNTDSRWRILK